MMSAPGHYCRAENTPSVTAEASSIFVPATFNGFSAGDTSKPIGSLDGKELTRINSASKASPTDPEKFQIPRTITPVTW